MSDQEETPLSVVQQRIAAIQEERARIEAQSAAAAQVESDRCATMDQAKAACVAECSEVDQAIADCDDAEMRAELVNLAAEIHAPHAAALEAAHLAFSGQQLGESNPAAPADVTPLAADVATTSVSGA